MQSLKENCHKGAWECNRVNQLKTALFNSWWNDSRDRSGSWSLGGRAFQDASPENENDSGPRAAV